MIVVGRLSFDREGICRDCDAIASCKPYFIDPDNEEVVQEEGYTITPKIVETKGPWPTARIYVVEFDGNCIFVARTSDNARREVKKLKEHKE